MIRSDENIFQVRLAYLQDREYVDISTVSNAFFRAVGLSAADSSIETEAIRIFRELRFHGELREGAEPFGASAKFEFTRAGTKRRFSYFESQSRIFERVPEPQLLWWDCVRLAGGCAHFTKPMGGPMTYNLMIMGKALILHLKSRVPRVVSTDLKFQLTAEHYLSLRMELHDLRNDFVQLRTFVGEKSHGIVNVKLLKETAVLAMPE